MSLHPQVAAMRAKRERNKSPQLYTLTLAEARAADLADIQATSGSPEPVAEVIDRAIAGPEFPPGNTSQVPLRTYRPSPHATGILVYFFGGGWTLGSIDTSDAVCRRIANLAGCVVVSAGYRLAPEHRFPAAVHDCEAAVRWVHHNAAELGFGSVPPIAIGGDSAGGNLAAAVTLLTRDLQLAGQLLVYPNTDYGANTSSLHDNTDPWLFNKTSVSWYWENYLADPADGDNPLASPLRAADHSGLPPALVITAEHDPLRDEGEAYAARLAEAGVPVQLARYDGMVHGFFCMAGELDDGERAVAQAADYLRAAFAS